MAATILQKLLKKPFCPPLRSLTSINKSNLSPLLAPEPVQTPDPSPHPPHLPIFPSYPYWFHLTPIRPRGPDPPSDERIDSVESDRMVWADSVKKKRKKKMNKHKYRKLRKRLRRQA